MKKISHLKRLTVLAITMLVLDIIWITVVVGPIYHDAFKAMVRLRLLPAIAFYVLFNLGLYYFAFVKNEKATPNLMKMDAIFFGLCVYGGYALTLLAVFAFYLVEIALLEMFWGGLVSFLAVQSVILFEGLSKRPSV